MSDYHDSNRERHEIQPPDEPTSFQSFQRRLEQGDEKATQELFEKYSLQLARIAGRNIHPALLKRFDGEDVVQSVFRTFFRRHEEGKIRIERADQLWKLLVTITLCKTRTHARIRPSGVIFAPKSTAFSILIYATKRRLMRAQSRYGRKSKQLWLDCPNGQSKFYRVASPGRASQKLRSNSSCLASRFTAY